MIKFFKISFYVIFFFSSSLVVGKTPKEWMEQAFYVGYEGNVEESIQIYTKSIEIYPNEEILYLGRGTAKQGKGDLDDAIKDFTKAIELNSNFANAYFARGKAKKAKGDTDGAKADIALANEINTRVDYVLERLNKQILADPTNPELYWDRAKHKEIRDNKSGSIKDLDKYFELVGQPSLHAYLTRGGIKEEIGDISGAMSDYNTMIEQYPSVYGYKRRARLKKDIGDLEGVKADELEAEKLIHEKTITTIQNFHDEVKKLEANPSEYNIRRQVYFLKRIASNQIDIEDYAEAVISLTKAIEINHATPVAENLFEKRAKAKKALGDMESYETDMEESRWVNRREKLQLLNQILEFNPQDVNALVERATIWIYVKEYSKALEDSDRAIKIDSSSIEALKVRAKAKKKLGDSKGSRADRSLIWQIQNNQ